VEDKYDSYEEEEILIIRIHKGKHPINMVTTYGKQESGEVGVKEEIVQQINLWEQIIIEMQRKEGHVLWIGDLNVKIGNDDRGIAGNHPEVMHGDRMLRKLTKERDLQLINATEKCTGLWTSINTWKKDEKSILDYVITSRKMTEKIQMMHIDKEGL